MNVAGRGDGLPADRIRAARSEVSQERSRRELSGIGWIGDGVGSHRFFLLGAELAGVVAEAERGVFHAARDDFERRNNVIEMPRGQQCRAGRRDIADRGFRGVWYELFHGRDRNSGWFSGGAEVNFGSVDRLPDRWGNVRLRCSGPRWRSNRQCEDRQKCEEECLTRHDLLEGPAGRKDARKLLITFGTPACIEATLDVAWSQPSCSADSAKNSGAPKAHPAVPSSMFFKSQNH